jgi:Ran GTPase-activating protein (RanGAP) involved in mRNA processing and transport
LAKALGERLASRDLELLNLAETGMTTEQLGGLIDGAIKSGLRRLGIAGNSITPEGMQHVARFLRDGSCEGLDLGGNDLKDQLGVIADALDDNNDLYALSLADCSLTPDSLWSLFPALVKLKNFRFIDLSQNHALFDTQPSALSLLRRYVVFVSYSQLPQFLFLFWGISQIWHSVRLDIAAQSPPYVRWTSTRRIGQTQPLSNLSPITPS